MALAQLTTIVATARSRVLSQYAKLTTYFLPKLDVFTGSVQELENVFWDLYGQLGLTATGIWLDRQGYIVGEFREGVTNDVTFLRFIQARILANKSNGLLEEILAVARLVVNDLSAVYVVKDSPPAALELEIKFYALTTLRTRTLRMLGRTKAAGVRLMVIYWPDADETTLFTTDTGVGLGFDDASSPGAGGKFVGAEAP